MSSQTISDLFSEIEAHYKVEVLKGTWGHLAPRKNKTYRGYIIYAIAEDGLYCLISYDFENLPGSPWLYDALQDFIGENTEHHGMVYRFDGTFRNYEFSGIIKEIPCG